MVNNKILGLVGLSARARRVVFGTDSVIDAIDRNRVRLVIIATDSSERTKKNLIETCKEYNVKYIIYSTIDELSKSIGKENKAIVGIKDSNIAREIQKIYDGGDIIG